MRAFDLVLFDLDGTLSESAPGIIAALRHAFAANGLPEPDEQTLHGLLGPPFYESLPPLLGGTDRLADVIEAYREYYAGGSMYDTAVYPGIIDVLDAARAADMRLAVATSKPEYFAVQIVARLGLADYFATVGGDEPDGSLPTKALVVDKVLGRLGRPRPQTAVMIGDRAHDVVGARAHGIACVGAGWGYGLPGELSAAGADPICTHPVDLFGALGLAPAAGGAAAS